MDIEKIRESKKALIEYEGVKYWVDMTEGFPSVQTLENGRFRDTKVSEVDLFDLLERGHVLSGEKPA